MKPWWERSPDVLVEEQEAFAAHGLKMAMDLDLLRDEGRVVMRGTYNPRGEDIDLEVHYPDDYPATRFTAVAKNLHLPRHQNPHGNLCLLGRSSDQWRREWRAAEVIADQLPDLLDMESMTAEALQAIEDPQGEPASAYLVYEDSGSILVPDDLHAAADGHQAGTMTVTMLGAGAWPAVDPASQDLAGQGTLTTLTPNGETTHHTLPALVSRCHGREWNGVWVRLDEVPSAVVDTAAIIDDLVREGVHVRFSKTRINAQTESAIVGVVFTEEVRQGVYSDSWIFFAITRPASARTGGRTGRPGAVGDRKSIRLIRGLRTGAVTHGERVPEVAALRDMTVVLIGLGTLGSPIARELAKAQVGELVMVDHDFSDAGPIVRWDAGLRAVGQSKGRALQAELAADYPFTKTMALDLNVGNTYSGRGPGRKDELELALLGADLIIDATAEWNIREVVAAYAEEAQLSLITLWSIEGYGGVVLRSRPGDEACYYCRELWLSPESGAVELPTGPADPTRIQPAGCADRTFAATSPDLRPLADHAVRMAFGELAGGIANAYPLYEFDVYVCWHREPDGSLVDPPRWTAESLPRHPDCTCHAAA